MTTLGPYDLNTIITGDARELAKAIPDESVDLIYADFVYDDLDFAWVDDCVRILKNTGSFYAQTDYRSVAQLKLYLDDRLIFTNWIVWCYKAFPTRKRYYQRKHDDILFYTKSDDYSWNEPSQAPSKSSTDRFKTDKSGRIINPTATMKNSGYAYYVRDVTCRDWWDDIPVPSGFNKWDTGKKIHKWQKPYGLIERIISASSNMNDVVYDPFVGSGTTAFVCKMLQRNYLAFEIDPATADMARKRVAETQPPLPIVMPEQMELI